MLNKSNSTSKLLHEVVYSERLQLFFFILKVPAPTGRLTAWGHRSTCTWCQCTRLGREMSPPAPVHSPEIISFNPKGIGVKYYRLVLGGEGQHHVSVLTSLLDFLILNWNFRYLSWLRQYQTGKFVLLLHCYNCANMGTFFKKYY